MPNQNMDLDSILSELGEFGKFQIQVYFLLLFPMAFSAMTQMSYVFTAGDIDYRCKVPECEGNTTSYEEPWLPSALPYTDGKLESRCKRYKPIETSYQKNCTQNIFIQEQTENCSSFIFRDNENTIIKEEIGFDYAAPAFQLFYNCFSIFKTVICWPILNTFDLLCEENYWKKTLVGTLSNVGDFIGMPLAGAFSDRFGRKTMIIASVICSSITGILRSFTSNYTQFMAWEILNAIAVAGVYSGVFVLGIEITGPKKRALGGVLLFSYFPIGEVMLGALVWLVNDWRIYLRIIHIPALIMILYFWIIPESIRWLLSRGKREKLLEVLEKISYLNKKSMNEDIRKSVQNIENADSKELKGRPENASTKDISENLLMQVMKSKIILLRVLAASFCWIVNAFVYYGLSLLSTSLIGGNKYFNFILVSLIEIPGFIMTLSIDVVGRRSTFSGALIVSGLACTMFHFVDPDTQVARLILFLIAKCAIALSFSLVYIYAAEFFPTNLRNSLISFCSTIGRFGSMLAPQTPLLAAYVDPVLVFGAVAFISAVVTLHFPETSNCKLPDTIEEAEEIGRGSSKTKQQQNNLST